MTRPSESRRARQQIVSLLAKSTPMLASQIAWKLGMTPASVASHLGHLRSADIVSARRIFHPTAAVRIGHQVFRINQVFWTTAERKGELYSLQYFDVRTNRHVRRRSRPFTGDMYQMIEDIRYAASQ